MLTQKHFLTPEEKETETLAIDEFLGRQIVKRPEDDYRRDEFKRETGYYPEQLRAALNMVAHPDNWKKPIKRCIPRLLLDIVNTAVLVYTGSEIEVTIDVGEKAVIRAGGYYENIGS